MAGISLILQNNPTVTQINCGTSSPRLGGTINLSAFPNLQEFRCNNNDITAISGYAGNSNLRVIEFFNNKMTGSIPSLSVFTGLQIFSCDRNLFIGTIPTLSSNTALRLVSLHSNQLSGTIPSLNANAALQFYYCQANQLTGSIPSLSSNTDLRLWHSAGNPLTGLIPNLAANTELREFWCFANNLTGSIPSLSANTKLRFFYCNINRLSGSIPDLSANTELEVFHCQNQQAPIKITGFAGDSVSNTLGNFQAQINQLTASSVNSILAAFVAANRTVGTRVLNLGGVGNAAPTGQGITDKATLISRGWTVTTN
jgi:hypothetical protein